MRQWKRNWMAKDGGKAGRGIASCVERDELWYLLCAVKVMEWCILREKMAKLNSRWTEKWCKTIRTERGNWEEKEQEMEQLLKRKKDNCLDEAGLVIHWAHCIYLCVFWLIGRRAFPVHFLIDYSVKWQVIFLLSGKNGHHLEPCTNRLCRSKWKKSISGHIWQWREWAINYSNY